LELLTRDKLFAAKLPIERVDIPALDAFVFVRAMSAVQKDAYDMQLATGDKAVSFRAFVFVRCAVTEDGHRIFSNDDEEKVANEVPPALIDAVFDKAHVLGGLTAEAVATAKKNSKRPKAA